MRTRSDVRLRTMRSTTVLCALAAVLVLPIVPLQAQVPEPDLRETIAALVAQAEVLAAEQVDLRAEVARLQSLEGDARVAPLAKVAEWKVSMEIASETSAERATAIAMQLVRSGELAALAHVREAIEEIRSNRIPETIRYSAAVVENRTGPIVDQYEQKIAEDLALVAELLAGAPTEFDRPVRERLLTGVSLLVAEHSGIQSDVARLQPEESDEGGELLAEILERKAVMELRVAGFERAIRRHIEVLREAGDTERAAELERAAEVIVEESIPALVRYTAAVVENRTGPIVAQYEERVAEVLSDLQTALRAALSGEGG